MDYEKKITLLSWGCAFIMSIAIVILTYWALVIWSSTGPGCPGDPAYLGYCSEVDGS